MSCAFFTHTVPYLPALDVLNLLPEYPCFCFKFWPQVLWDLSSQIRDQTCTPSIGRQSLNHWTTRDILWNMFFKLQNPWVLVTQSCPTLCNPTDYSLSGSSVHGIFQARILEWVVIAFSRGSSWPRDWIEVSCIAGRFFTMWAALKYLFELYICFMCFSVFTFHFLVIS